MTSKDRAKLKAIAARTETILQIGKNPIGETFVKQVRDALKARELIKIHVLETCELTPNETALALAEAAECEVVQVIGSRVVLFKQRKKGDEKGSYLEETGQKKKPNEKSRLEKRSAVQKDTALSYKKGNFSKERNSRTGNNFKSSPNRNPSGKSGKIGKSAAAPKARTTKIVKKQKPKKKG